MSSGEHQVALRDDRDDLADFGQQFAIARYRNEGPALFGITDLVFCIVGRHPNETAPAAFDYRHAFNGGRIDPADGAIQVDPSEDFNAWHFLPDYISQRSR